MRTLVPLDGSALSEAVIPHVLRLLRHDRERSEVHLLRAVEPASAQHGSHAEARLHLGQVQRRLADEGFRVRKHLAEGDPVRAILELVVEERIDLLAMSTHGRRGFGRWLHGSVAEQVIDDGSVAVLLVNPRTPPPDAARAAARFLFPIDAACAIEEAIQLVAALGTTSNATVILLGLRSASRPLADVAQASLEERDVLTVVSILEDAPQDGASSVILEAAGEATDLLVLCTGHRSARSSRPRGEASEHLLRRAPCPVLLLRAPRPGIDPGRPDELESTPSPGEVT